MYLKSNFLSETEEQRRRICEQIHIQGHRLDEMRPGTIPGVLPLTVPDGARIMVYPDLQVVDPGIFEGALRFADWWRQHLTVQIGDYAENYWLSAYPKNPFAPSPSTPQSETEKPAENLRKIMERGNPFMTLVIEGNHDDARGTNFATRLMFQAAGLLGATSELLLDTRSRMRFEATDPIIFVTGQGRKGGNEGGILLNERQFPPTKLQHGKWVDPIPGFSAWKHYLKSLLQISMGHTHRLGHFAIETKDGRYVIECMETGNLIKHIRPEYLFAPEHNWQHGFGTITCYKGMPFLQPIPIIEAPDEHGDMYRWFYYLDEDFNAHVFQCDR